MKKTRYPGGYAISETKKYKEKKSGNNDDDDDGDEQNTNARKQRPENNGANKAKRRHMNNNFHASGRVQDAVSLKKVHMNVYSYLQYILRVTCSPSIISSTYPSSFYEEEVRPPSRINQLTDITTIIPTIVYHILKYNNIEFADILIYESRDRLLEVLEYCTVSTSEPSTTDPDAANLSYLLRYEYPSHYTGAPFGCIDASDVDIPINLVENLIIVVDKTLLNQYIVKSIKSLEIMKDFDFSQFPKLHPLQCLNESEVGFNKTALLNTLIICDHLATHIIYDMNREKEIPNEKYHENFTKYGITLHTIFKMTGFARKGFDDAEKEREDGFVQPMDSWL